LVIVLISEKEKNQKLGIVEPLSIRPGVEISWVNTKSRRLDAQS
jgi:hypothetical protein